MDLTDEEEVYTKLDNRTLGANQLSDYIKANYISKKDLEKDKKCIFNGDSVDLSMIMVNAERYALGKKTYIVQWTCDSIIKNIELLTNNDKQTMIKDIEEAHYLGDDCDEKNWLKLLEKLRE